MRRQRRRKDRRWLWWPADDPAPHAISRRGAAVWSMAQRQIAVSMMREMIAAGRIPASWTCRRLP